MFCHFRRNPVKVSLLLNSESTVFRKCRFNRLLNELSNCGLEIVHESTCGDTTQPHSVRFPPFRNKYSKLKFTATVDGASSSIGEYMKKISSDLKKAEYGVCLCSARRLYSISVRPGSYTTTTIASSLKSVWVRSNPGISQ